MSAPGLDPLWSILIPTLMWREKKLLALLESLLPQCEQSPAPIEVLGMQNVGQKSLARYRQDLLERSRGRYVSFVDDDDEVAGGYVKEIVAALEQGPDCVGFLQLCSGLGAPLTVLSLAHEDRPPLGVEETIRGPAYIRAFSHMCPVLAELARKGTFMANGELYSGEDTTYVDSVLPFLRERGSREVFIDKPLYHYRWSGSDTTQNRGTAPTGLAARAVYHRRPHVPGPCFRWVP
jgi:hypothetical protein